MLLKPGFRNSVWRVACVVGSGIRGQGYGLSVEGLGVWGQGVEGLPAT